MAKTSFAEEMKQHQLSWALANGVTWYDHQCFKE